MAAGIKLLSERSSGYAVRSLSTFIGGKSGSFCSLHPSYNFSATSQTRNFSNVSEGRGSSGEYYYSDDLWGKRRQLSNGGGQGRRDFTQISGNGLQGYDVVIVGGGAVGSSVALHLAQMNDQYRILVIERDRWDTKLNLLTTVI